MALTVQPNSLWSEETKLHLLGRRLSNIFNATCKSSRDIKTHQTSSVNNTFNSFDQGTFNLNKTFRWCYPGDLLYHFYMQQPLLKTQLSIMTHSQSTGI